MVESSFKLIKASRSLLLIEGLPPIKVATSNIGNDYWELDLEEDLDDDVLDLLRGKIGCDLGSVQLLSFYNTWQAKNFQSVDVNGFILTDVDYDYLQFTLP